MSYFVRIKASAENALAKMDESGRRRLIDAIEALKTNPASGSLLKGEHTGLRRIRVGDYRIVFEVLQAELVILAIRVGHRREVCR